MALNIIRQTELWIRQSLRRSIHVTSSQCGLAEFFDDPKNYGERRVRSGRAWNIDELRLKSNGDLHKLWFVLYKERNMLHTMKEAAAAEFEVFPSPERIDKVEESMANLENVVRERNKAYWQLEVSPCATGERPSVFRRDVFGRHRWHKCSQHIVPYHRNWQFRNAQGPGRNDETQTFISFYREMKRKHYNFSRARKARYLRDLFRRFPNADADYLAELNPEYPEGYIRHLKENHILYDDPPRRACRSRINSSGPSSMERDPLSGDYSQPVVSLKPRKGQQKMMQQPTVNVEFEEDLDGVRFNWNRWPSSRIELEKVVLTLGCLYTPLREPTDSRYHLELQQAPITCCRTTCKAVLNPYCYPDLQSQQKGWICNFCNQRNQFPQQYQHIVDPAHITELCRNTIDYVQLNQPTPHPPVFLFIVDFSIEEDELTALKTSILSSLALLPPNALVGFITFTHTVYLWELNDGQNLSSVIFCGSKGQSPKRLQEWLGLSLASTANQQPAITNPRPMPFTNGHPANFAPPQLPSAQPLQPPRMNFVPPAMGQNSYRQPQATLPPQPGSVPAQSSNKNINRFLKPAGQVESVLTSILEQLGKDFWPTPPGHRPQRAVGAALSAAINILEATYPNCAARMMLFLGGPCTIGPGMVVDCDLKNTIRTHHDIDKDNARFLKKATEFYQTLATRASNNGHAIDIFSCALDQTGLHEMKCCTNMTNGLMVMGDSFDSNLFKTSFQRIFSRDKKANLRMAFNAILDVKTSRELRVSGAIGSCISMNKKTNYVADKRDGIGGTSQWKFCSLIPSSTTAFYFVVQSTPTVTSAQQVPCGYVQFITQYNSSDGFKHVRVTTVRRYFGSDEYEFDQESAAVLLARMACFRSDSNEGTGQEILRWIDKSLVKVCQKFGDFHPNSPESFRLRQPFAMFPQFLFNLRRSQFIQVFNNSPDETSFYRHSLMREDCSNSLLMIQPALVAYELHKETAPVSLDTSSIQPDRILMMDTFFQIVIFHGERIAAWKKQNYQEKEGYESFKMFLEAPINDSNDLMMSRFPLPRYVVCDQGSSQARFLLSRVNPSITHNNHPGYGDQSAAPVLSDDVSYAVFEEHLRRLTVSSST